MLHSWKDSFHRNTFRFVELQVQLNVFLWVNFDHDPCKRSERDQYEQVEPERKSTTAAGCARPGTCNWAFPSLLPGGGQIIWGCLWAVQWAGALTVIFLLRILSKICFSGRPLGFYQILTTKKKPNIDQILTTHHFIDQILTAKVPEKVRIYTKKQTNIDQISTTQHFIDQILTAKVP